MTINDKKADYLLPASIIIAALLVAGAWIYTGGTKNNDIFRDKGKSENKMEEADLTVLKNIKSITVEDHIRGSAEATVKVVEFSDLECPFCKVFHQTMKQVLAEYSGKVNLVFRHYPIEQLHSKAKKSAEAAECAAELGGNEKFWDFIDQYFYLTPSNNQMDMSKLPEIAASIGLNRGQFEACLESGKYQEKIKEQIKEAIAVGVKGTPYSVIIAKDGRKIPIIGALPFEDYKNPYGETQKGIKSLIEEALK